MILLALHIPDGFLSPGLSLIGWLLAALGVLPALYLVQRRLDDRTLPLMGILAAFIFVAQTLQFPVPGGTSAHLQGSALAGILLGPWAGLVVLTAVLGVQGFILGDGGILTMGWNIVNMGLVGVWTGAGLCALARRQISLPVATLLAAWISVELSSLATCFELAWAGTSPLAVSLPAMLSVQALVGLGEGVVCAGALQFIYKHRPGLLAARQETALA